VSLEMRLAITRVSSDIAHSRQRKSATTAGLANLFANLFALDWPIQADTG